VPIHFSHVLTPLFNTSLSDIHISIMCLLMIIISSMVAFPLGLRNAMMMQVGFSYTHPCLYLSWVISYPLSFIFSTIVVSLLRWVFPPLYFINLHVTMLTLGGCWKHDNLHMWSFLAKHPLYYIFYMTR
jgi:hypothetical protein